MIIDFHTHTFPDKIAKKAIENLEDTADGKAFHNGTIAQLKESMNKANIDICINLPVLTSVSQFDSILEFAKNINCFYNNFYFDSNSSSGDRKGIISFAGIHPDDNLYEEHIDRIVEAKIKGIKIHPDYQETYIDDDKYIKIILYAIKKGLIIVTHAGLDFVSMDNVHCTPKRLANLLNIIEKEMPKAQKRIVAAHTGGYDRWDEVEEYLCNRDIYFDTSFSFHKIDREQFKRIIAKHRSDRILFATDSPWDDQLEDVTVINNLGFDKNLLDNILYKNACNLLNIEI